MNTPCSYSHQETNSNPNYEPLYHSEPAAVYFPGGSATGSHPLQNLSNSVQSSEFYSNDHTKPSAFVSSYDNCGSDWNPLQTPVYSTPLKNVDREYWTPPPPPLRILLQTLYIELN